MKPRIRSIHHLSCTGGTLISKCIASMPGAALLSEVHPFNIGGVRFNPFDPVQQMFSQGIVGRDEEALKHCFRGRVEMAHHLCSMHGKNLVLRDHTHTDWLVKREPSEFRKKSLINTLKYDYEIISVLTVRNPVDTYLSLNKNGWSKGVGGFDEYCSRVLGVRGRMID